MLSIEGIIINIDTQSRKRIEIGNDGIISAIIEPTGQADIVLKDELIFPGFIDLHVHARECADHSQDYKEDFTTAGEAAINGGVAAFAEMPNNPVPPVDNASYAEKSRLAEKCSVDILFYAGIGANTEPLSRSVPIYGRTGSPINRHATVQIPYKAFMGPSIGNLFFSTNDEMASVLEKYRGQAVSFHCEDPKILEANKNQPTHELRRPAEAESVAVDFAIGLIKKFNLEGKLCHISTAEAVEKIRQAKLEGINVTAEAAPHHLFFDSESPVGNGLKPFPTAKFLQVNPPIRSNKDRLSLIEGLKDGTLDYIATDHAPHTIAEKEKGVSGMPHLDTYGPFVSWLMKVHNFTAPDIARVCSYNPGRFINKFSMQKFGEIKEGFTGSLTIMNMSRPVKIEKSMLKTKCAWSPFEGITFPGSVVYTIVKGKTYRM